MGADPPELAKAIGRYLLTPAPATAQTKTPPAGAEAAPKPATGTGSAPDSAPQGLAPELRARLEQLLHQAPLMLFMKGSPDNVRCKFSRQMVELLNETKHVLCFGFAFVEHVVQYSLLSALPLPFLCECEWVVYIQYTVILCRLSYGHFDILSDESVRQGLKQYSSWPTYPQLYARGRLVGGVDIVSQMRADGSLLAELRAAFDTPPPASQ